MANEVSIGTLTLGIEAVTSTFERDMAGVVKAMSKVDAAMKRVAKTADLSGSKVAAMSAKVGGAMASIDPMLGKASAAADELAAIFDKLRLSATASGTATKNSAAQVARGIDAVGKAADRSIRPATSMLDRFAVAMDKAASAVRPVGAAAARGRDALVDLGGNAVSVAGDFEAAMTKAAIVTDSLGEEGAANFGLMRDAALDAASATEFTATKAAQGIELMGQAGFDTSQILAGLPKVLQLASAASVSVGKATDVAANTINAFGLSVEDDLERVNDIFVTTANSSNTNFNLLAGALKPVAPIARNVGLELEDTAAILGKLADAGIKGSKAGTSLRGILATMLAPSKKTKEVMDDLNLSFTNTDGTLKDFGTILRELGPIANDTGALFKIFGRLGGPGMAVLLNEGADSIENFGDQLRNSAGAAAEAAAANMATFNGRVAALNSKVEGANIIIGDIIKDALLPLVAALDSVVEAFIDLPDWVQTSAVALGAIAATVLALVAAFAGLVIVVAQIASAFAALAAVKATLVAIAAVVGFIGALAAAIGAGILGAISIINQMHNVWLFFESDIKRGVGEITDALGQIGALFFDGFVAVVEELTMLFVELFGGAFDEVATFADELWSGMAASLQNSMGEALDWLDMTFGSTANSAADIFGNMLDFTAGLITAIIPDAWVSAFNSARVAFPDFLTELEIAGKNIIKVLTAAFESVFDAVRSALGTVFDLLGAAAGFGLEVTGTQAGGQEEASGGFFGNIGKDLVKSLGFEDVADASEKFSNALAAAKKEVEKSSVSAQPRRRTAASISAGKVAAKEAEKASKSAQKDSDKEAKARDKVLKAKGKAIDKELEASTKALENRIAAEERLKEDARKQAAAAAASQTQVFDSWTEALQSSLVGSLGDMGTVINGAIQGFQAGGVWGAVIGAVFELVKRTDGFESAIGKLNEVFDAMVDAIGPLTQALGPLVSFITDNLLAVFEGVGLAFRFVGVVLSGVILVVLTIFKKLADAWNFVIDALDKVLSKIGISLGRLRIQTGGLEDAIADAKSNIEDFAFGTRDVVEEQEKETDQLRELNDQLLNAPEGFKVSLERFNATVRDGGAAVGGGGLFNQNRELGPTGSDTVGGDVRIDQVTIVTDDPEILFDEFDQMRKWNKLKNTGTSRQTGGTFSSSSEQRFAK